ncbi:MAG: T9SS type A sorting domain-containing protein [Bacteroidia bacterium]
MSITVLNDGKVVCTFSGRRNSSGAFTASSGVFIYDPVANSWSDVSDAGMHYWTKDLVLDPSDANQNTWYVGVFSGWGGPPNGLGGLYKTTDRGAHWIKLTNQFNSVTSISFNPQNTQQAFLTTETQGLWFTPNITLAPPLWNLVSSYPFRQPERVFFNPYQPDEMWVTSFGNGMKVGSVNVVTGINNPNNDESIKVQVSPNPFVNSVTAEFYSLQNERALIKLSSLTGAVIYEKEILLSEGKNVLSIDNLRVQDGIYLLSIKGAVTNKNIKLIKVTH